MAAPTAATTAAAATTTTIVLTFNIFGFTILARPPPGFKTPTLGT